MTQPYPFPTLFLHATPLTASKRKRLPRSGFVQTGLWEVGRPLQATPLKLALMGRSPLASFSVLDGGAFRTSGLSRQEIRTHLSESRFYSSRRSTRWRLTLILSADRVLRQHPFTVQLSGKAAPPIMRSSCSRARSSDRDCLDERTRSHVQAGQRLDGSVIDRVPR